MKKLLCLFLSLFGLWGCMQYESPARSEWHNYLRGASFADMNETARLAKKPIFLGDGGRTVATATENNHLTEYGNTAQNESVICTEYMTELENKLYDALRKPGASVQRAGTDVLVLLVRDAIMELDAPEISSVGDDNLAIIANILKKYDATFIEIAGYTDSMRDSSAAHALSFDMAGRVAVYLARHGIRPTRLFVVGRGAARPIAAQDELGRLTNRRVEIRILPVR